MTRTWYSPTGSQILGTLERLSARAEIVDIDPKTGEPEYQGSTTIFWGDERTVTRDGKTVFLDENGAEWTFDQLTSEEDDE